MKNNGIIRFLFGEAIAIALTLVLALIFAFVVQLTTMNDAVITIVNQFIKTICITVGVLFGGIKSRGALKGGLLGLIYAFLAFVIFGLIAHDLTFDFRLLLDLLFGIIIGAIAGVMSVNIKNR